MTTEERREWLEKRQRIVTGSDVSCLFGVHPFGKTTAQLFDEKVGTIVDMPPTGDMKRGIKLEPLAIEEYVEETGRVVRSRDLTVNPDFPWLGGTLDREQAPIPEFEGPGTLEVKCPRVKTFNRYINEGLHEGYILQEQTYNGVYDHKWGSFLIFSGESWKGHFFDLERDDELIANIVRASKKFMDMVKRGERPEGPVAEINVKAVGGLVIQREDPEWATAWVDYWEAKALETSSKQLIAEARLVIEELCGEYGSFEGANTRLHWKLQKGRKTFDHKRLALAGPLNRDTVLDVLASNLGAEATAQLDIEGMALDLETFFNQGDPKPSFRPYPIKSKQEEE